MAIKLNLGCGEMKIDGYTGIDLYDEEADVKADICDLPFEDNSVDEIVAYQVIEHVPYNQSHKMFSEMHRVLKPDHHAIVETPDIDYVCKAILKDGLTDNWMYNLVGEYYRPWDKDRYEDWEMNAASIHRNPWNFTRLGMVAYEVGFSGVEINDERHPLYNVPENLSVRLTK